MNHRLMISFNQLFIGIASQSLAGGHTLKENKNEKFKLL
jgi:hypothetical protein